MFGRSKVKALPSRADAALARRRSRTNKMTIAVTAFVTVLALAWAIGTFLLSNAVSIQDVNKEKVEEPLPTNAFSAWPNSNDYPRFSKTLKECRPEKQQECLQFIPDKKERIAIIRPPGEFGYMFERFVSDVVEYHRTNTTNLELLPTSHVPPYGYGKTHGYTKIIRLEVSPLMTQGADLLRDSEDDVGNADLKQVVREVVRWHCRLSHVAAHTAMLTVTFESIISQAAYVSEEIREFLNLQSRSDMEHFMDDGFLETDELAARLEIVMESIHKILAKANSQTTQPIQDIIHQVIEDELDKTDNLKKWPCLSFWNVGEELSPVARKLAAAFAPNCSADFAHCGVPRDLCEERGDPLCKSSRKIMG